jgi:uncharacterized membrane protein
LCAPFAAFSVLLLAVTGDHPIGEWQRLWGAGLPVPDALAMLRWSAVSGMFALFAWRGRDQNLRALGQGAGVLIAYGAIAQLVPTLFLPLVPAVAVLALSAAQGRLPWNEQRFAVVASVVISAGWMVVPLGQWLAEAAQSLGGIPMRVDSPVLDPVLVLRRLLVPVLLLGIALWLVREKLWHRSLMAAGAILGAIGLVALHIFYRTGFGFLASTDFTVFGLGQRLLWDGLLLTLATILWKRGNGAIARVVAPALLGIVAFHGLWYSLLLHNPLWSAQNVGSVPLANLLLPLFGLLPLCLYLLGHMRADWAGSIDRLLQPVLVAMVALFCWASLRHAFHGTLLIDPGLSQPEDILRSILGIALAIGYLLWGIRAQRHDWRIASLGLMLVAVAKVFLLDASGLEGLLRIASFVALGFSLIGIGWLYSRQLRREQS